MKKPSGSWKPLISRSMTYPSSSLRNSSSSRRRERVNMRLPKPLLDGVKARASAEGMPYQRYIRKALEEALARPAHKKAG